MKASRPTIIAAALLASLALLSLASCCLWFVAIRPYKERERRIALATDFLEAYSEGDCARAKALMDPAKRLLTFHSSDPLNPETFCREYRIRIVELDDVRDAPDYLGISYAGRSVWFDGIFEITDHGVGPYPCPHVKVDFHNRDNEWVVTGWQDYWDTRIQRFYCDGLIAMRKSTSPWPLCSDAPGVSLELRRIDDTTIELVAEGLDPEGVFYIFYSPSYGRDLSGVVPVYTSNGRSVAFVGLETTEIDPWATGRFVYTLTDLPPLQRTRLQPTWEVFLVHRRGVACAETTLP